MMRLIPHADYTHQYVLLSDDRRQYAVGIVRHWSGRPLPWEWRRDHEGDAVAAFAELEGLLRYIENIRDDCDGGLIYIDLDVMRQLMYLERFPMRPPEIDRE